MELVSRGRIWDLRWGKLTSESKTLTNPVIPMQCTRAYPKRMSSASTTKAYRRHRRHCIWTTPRDSSVSSCELRSSVKFMYVGVRGHVVCCPQAVQVYSTPSVFPPNAQKSSLFKQIGTYPLQDHLLFLNHLLYGSGSNFMRPRTRSYALAFACAARGMMAGWVPEHGRLYPSVWSKANLLHVFGGNLPSGLWGTILRIASLYPSMVSQPY